MLPLCKTVESKIINNKMFQNVRKSIKNVASVIESTYNDPFKWSVVKSLGFFALGVKIALECKGMDIMPPVTL